MQKPVSLVDFYCSEIGNILDNNQVFQNIVNAVPKDSSKKMLWFYDKILQATPARQRKFIPALDEVLSFDTRAQRLASYERVIRELMCDAVNGVFKQSKLTAADIDFVVVTSSVGLSMPSAASIVANSFDFKDHLVTLNLGGMSCSSGLAALDAGMRFLQSERKVGRCLVVSLEAVTNLFNLSEENIAPNSLFGEGCAAVILSTHKESALYQIKHSVRTISADSTSFNAIKYQESDAGPWIKLSRKLALISAKPISKNLKQLIPKILPIRAKIEYFLNKKTPKWQTLIDYWAIHPGGTEILHGISDNLTLTQGDLGHSHRVFMRRSNMSSPSVFYVLKEIEKSQPKLKSSVLMMTFGAGFKVNTMILKRTKKTAETTSHQLIVRSCDEQITVFLKTKGTIGPINPLLSFDKQTSQQALKELIHQLWKKTLGIDGIIIDDLTINDCSSDFLLTLLTELYSLLLPHGTITLTRALVNNRNTLNKSKNLIKDVQEHLYTKYQSQAKKIKLSSANDE
jgi:predicted naringenin-chalcone synthase